MEFIIDFWGKHADIIIRFGIRLLILLAILLSANVARKIAKKTLRTAQRKYNKLDDTLMPVLLSIADYFIIGVCLVLVLDFLGVNTGSLIALLGAAGVAIGLALKDTLGNIASGIMLLFLRPFRVNDFVECGSISGIVQEIHLFTTIFQTVDGIYIAVPNTAIFSSAVKNYTRNGRRRMSLQVSISYSDSVEKGIEVLQRVALEDARIIRGEQDFEPVVLVNSMADSGVVLELRAWSIVDVYWDVYWDTNKRIKLEIEKAGLTIPFPQRDLHIIERKA